MRPLAGEAAHVWKRIETVLKWLAPLAAGQRVDPHRVAGHGLHQGVSTEMTERKTTFFSC
jgi:hypothetical protein